MESNFPTMSFSSSSSSKSDRRSKSKSAQTSSKPSLVMALISCFAWLYVAGRLWQDAENRVLLATLSKKNSQLVSFLYSDESTSSDFHIFYLIFQISNMSKHLCDCKRLSLWKKWKV